MKEEDKKNIIDILSRKKATLPCQRCGNTSFTVIDGYATLSLSEKAGDIVLGGKSIPTVIIACTNCGNLNQHALGALGLLEMKPKDEKKK